MIPNEKVLELKLKLEKQLAEAIAKNKKAGYAVEYVEKTVAIKEQLKLLEELMNETNGQTIWKNV